MKNGLEKQEHRFLITQDAVISTRFVICNKVPINLKYFYEGKKKLYRL